jgi:hypothetical protein
MSWIIHIKRRQKSPSWPVFYTVISGHSWYLVIQNGMEFLYGMNYIHVSYIRFKYFYETDKQFDIKNIYIY